MLINFECQIRASVQKSSLGLAGSGVVDNTQYIFEGILYYNIFFYYDYISTIISAPLVSLIHSFLLSGIDSVDKEHEDPRHLHVQRSKPPKNTKSEQPLLRSSISTSKGRTDQGRYLIIFEYSQFYGLTEYGIFIVFVVKSD